MRISPLGFSALRYGFFNFPHFIPKFLRYDRFVRIVNYDPFALVFFISLMVLIRNRTPTLLRHMSQISRIFKNAVHGAERPQAHVFFTPDDPVLLHAVTAGILLHTCVK